MGRGQQGVAAGCAVSLLSFGFKGINFQAFFLLHPSLFYLCPTHSSPKVHQHSHRPDRCVRGCGIICVPGHWQSQACCLLEQEGQEGQLPAYRGGCHSAQCSTSSVAAR